jgi:hypothetical protein
VNWKEIASFEQVGKPVMKQEPGAKLPERVDFDDVRHLPQKELRAFRFTRREMACL